MAVDTGVFERLKPKSDYDRAEEEFQLRRQLLSVKGQNAGGATITAARQLMAADPTLDFPSAFSIAKSGLGQGNTYSQGQVQNIAGAPQAFGNIEAAKQGMGEQAQKNVDVVMNPQIAGGEANARNASDRTWKPGTAAAVSASEQGMGGTQPLTPAQKAIDENFSKQYSDYIAAGGSADTKQQLIQLQNVKQNLSPKTAQNPQGGQNLTGPLVGSTPDFVNKFINPAAISNREAVEEVVQRSLRGILGAQFTENEGTRLIARAYNPNMDEAQNLTRVNRLFTKLEDAAAIKNDAAQYYEQNGTLRGWSGKLPTMADFESAIENGGDTSVVNRSSGNPMTDNAAAVARQQSVIGANPNAKADPRTIPMSAVKYLKANPGTAEQFDEMYGAGAAKMVTGR